MKKTCQTCAFWGGRPQYGQQRNYGVCDNSQFTDSNDYWSRTLPIDGATIFGDREHQNWIETGQSFGCIHYKLIPKGVIK